MIVNKIDVREENERWVIDFGLDYSEFSEFIGKQVSLGFCMPKLGTTALLKHYLTMTTEAIIILEDSE